MQQQGILILLVVGFLVWWLWNSSQTAESFDQVEDIAKENVPVQQTIVEEIVKKYEPTNVENRDFHPPKMAPRPEGHEAAYVSEMNVASSGSTLTPAPSPLGPVPVFDAANASNHTEAAVPDGMFV